MACASQHSARRRYRHTYAAELAEFAARVRDGAAEPEATVRRYAQLDLITAAAELSWRLRRAVKLDEVPALRKQRGGGSRL